MACSLLLVTRKDYFIFQMSDYYTEQGFADLSIKSHGRSLYLVPGQFNFPLIPYTSVSSYPHIRKAELLRR